MGNLTTKRFVKCEVSGCDGQCISIGDNKFARCRDHICLKMTNRKYCINHKSSKFDVTCESCKNINAIFKCQEIGCRSPPLGNIQDPVDNNKIIYWWQCRECRKKYPTKGTV